MIDEPRRRFHQDVLTIHHRKKNTLFSWKSLQRFIAQHFPASINNDFARLNAA